MKFILLLILSMMFSHSQAQGSSYALYDFKNSRYITEKNAENVYSIASITKLFTAITVIESGVDLNKTVKVNGKSRGHVPQGALISRLDLLKATLIKSDNRAAETLANHHPGGFSKFINDVNAYLQHNKLYSTQIVDSTGILANNKSSVADLISFLNILKNNPIVKSIAAERTGTVSIPNKKGVRTLELRNTNPELFLLDDVTISKTGFTSKAGRCVVMLKEDINGSTYAIVVLGQKSVKDRSKVVNNLLVAQNTNQEYTEFLKVSHAPNRESKF